jgi:hypothetical protein
MAELDASCNNYSGLAQLFVAGQLNSNKMYCGYTYSLMASK